MMFGQRVRKNLFLSLLLSSWGLEKAECGRAPADTELQNASLGIENPSAWPTAGRSGPHITEAPHPTVKCIHLSLGRYVPLIPPVGTWTKGHTHSTQLLRLHDEAPGPAWTVTSHTAALPGRLSSLSLLLGGHVAEQVTALWP